VLLNNGYTGELKSDINYYSLVDISQKMGLKRSRASKFVSILGASNPIEKKYGSLKEEFLDKNMLVAVGKKSDYNGKWVVSADVARLFVSYTTGVPLDVKEAVLNEISRDEEYFEKNNRGLFDAIEEEDKKKNNLTVNIGVLGTIPLEKWVLSVLRRYKEAYRNEIMDIIELSNKADLEKAKAMGLIEIKTESLPTIGGIEELPVEYITPIGQVIYEQRILKRYQMV